MKVDNPELTGPQYLRTLVVIWTAASVLLLLAWWHVIQQGHNSRAKELSAAERDLSNLTRLSQEHANRTLRNADQVIRFVKARHAEQGKRLNLMALSEQGVIDTEIFNQIGIIDANGLYAYANRPIGSKLDLSDREHFKVHRTEADIGLFISKPLIGRATGKWSVQLTRSIRNAQGGFEGVVVLSIDPGYFTRFYGELDLGANGVAALYGMDGIARARKIGNREEFGINAAASPMFRRMAEGASSGSYIENSVVDGVERMYYFRRVAPYPLVVVAGLDLQDVLVNHHRALDALILQAGFVSALILALAGALSRYLARMRHAMAERHKAQLQALERTEHLNAIFSMSPDGFVSFDAQHHVRYVSPAFHQMLETGDLRLEGMPEADFAAWLDGMCDPDTRFPGFAALRQRAGDAAHRDLIRIHATTRRVLHIGLRTSDSSAVSQILYARDVSFESAVDQMKSEFLSTAAHELRTPMASIFGFSELLLSTEVDQHEQREYLSIIHARAKAMAHILDELLDLARIEARRGTDFNRDNVQLQSLLIDVAKAFPRAENRSAPELSLTPEPVWVFADARKLQQALNNVLSNAYKYSPQGGAVAVSLAVVADDTGQPWARIEIRDSGIGMTPEQVARVFVRFYRADASGKIPGTGLGMSIVKELIELHGGSVRVVSTFGEGSCVTIRLPMLPALVGVAPVPVAANPAPA